MKKKGFTLIELLAVIIVLAIIALIATPTILNVVENSRKKAFEQTAIGYYNAAKYVYDEMYLNRNTQDVYFTFNNGEQVSSNENYQLKVKGDKPKGGLVYLTEEGSISVSIHNNKYCAMVEDDQKVRLSENIEECNFEVTEVPEECYLIKNEKLTGVLPEGLNATYNILYYDTTNASCPQEFNTLILPSEVNGQAVEGIGSKVFQNKSIKRVNIPESVIAISSFAFADNQLTNITISENVRYIWSKAFQNNQLKKVTYLAVDAYMNASSKNRVFMGNKIEEVVIGEKVVTIPNQLFTTQSIKKVAIPNSVTTIGSFAFANNQLTSIEIPNGVITIENAAFRNNQLTSITIPDSVTNIGIRAFNVNQLSDEQAFIYGRNSDGTEDKTTIVSYGGLKKDNVVIPETVTTIGDYAFEGNQLTSIDILESVTTIGTYAFENNQLADITIPSSVTSIGNQAFKDNLFENASAITIEGDATRFDSNWIAIGFPAK